MGDLTSFEFGPFRLEPGERRLLRHADPMALPPKAFDLLVTLVEHGDRLLRKEELMERLWPGTFVEEVNLAQNISAIRRVLGGSREEYIQTVAGTGYRFVAQLHSSTTPREA
jgi:DNA-binding winged helix-turn-helix (wHTH) protein